MNRIATASGAFNAFGSISCMLIEKRIWTCHMEFALYKLIIIFISLSLSVNEVKLRDNNNNNGLLATVPQSCSSFILNLKKITI